jgi:YHS domain-containing protein
VELRSGEQLHYEVLMLLKFVIIAIVVYLLIKLFSKGTPKREERTGYSRFQKPSAGEDLVEDPVCHTYIPVSSALMMNVDGKTVYFCSQKCLDAYVLESKR